MDVALPFSFGKKYSEIIIEMRLNSSFDANSRYNSHALIGRVVSQHLLEIRVLIPCRALSLLAWGFAIPSSSSVTYHEIVRNNFRAIFKTKYFGIFSFALGVRIMRVHILTSLCQTEKVRAEIFLKEIKTWDYPIQV